MKRTFGALFALTLIAFAAQPPAATATPQTPDLYNATSPAVTIGPVRGIASAVTGTWVSRAGYASAYAIITVGHIVDSATGSARYAVLQDSVAGSALAAVDSVLIDTVDNAVARIRYSGVKSHLRIVYRAGSAGDTTFISSLIMRGNARSR